MIDANDSALERREITLDCVAVRVAAHVFVLAVIDHFMADKLLAHTHVAAGGIGHQRRFASDVGNDQRAKRLAADVGNVMRADFALTLNKRMDDLLAHAANVLGVALADVLVLLFAADIGRIGFHDLAFAANRTNLGRRHGLADAMAHEPRALVCDPKQPVDLMGANALLARYHQVHRRQPLVQRDMRPLKQRADAHRELFTAIRAEVPSRTHRFAAKRLHGFHLTAVRAEGTIWPARGFKEIAGLIFVAESRVGQIAHNWAYLVDRLKLADRTCSVKY